MGTKWEERNPMMGCLALCDPIGYCSCCNTIVGSTATVPSKLVDDSNQNG